MKILLLTTILMASLSEARNESITFNSLGEFVPPDVVLYAKGYKSYNDGSFDTAINYFLKSVEFGNEKAKRMIAIIKATNNNYTEAYAWLSFSKVNTGNNNLLEKLRANLTETQMANSLDYLQELNEKYNKETSFVRRNKWEKGLKGGVGTRMRGIESVAFRNVNNIVNDTNTASAIEVKNRVLSYVKEYEPEGVVIQNEVKTVENE